MHSSFSFVISKWIFEKQQRNPDKWWNNFNRRQKKLISENWSPRFSSYHFFFKLSMTNCRKHPISSTQDHIPLCRPTRLSLQNDHAPKNFFSQLVWKILFFCKKLIWEKYSEPHFLQKRLYWFLSPDAPLPQTGHTLPQMVFTIFSENTVFFKKLV